jgi:hypothetical protein
VACDPTSNLNRDKAAASNIDRSVKKIRHTSRPYWELALGPQPHLELALYITLNDYTRVLSHIVALDSSADNSTCANVCENVITQLGAAGRRKTQVLHPHIQQQCASSIMDGARSTSIDALLAQVQETGTAERVAQCCCGRPQCAFLAHNSVALEGLEKDLVSAAQIGQVHFHSPPSEISQLGNPTQSSRCR